MQLFCMLINRSDKYMGVKIDIAIPYPTLIFIPFFLSPFSLINITY